MITEIKKLLSSIVLASAMIFFLAFPSQADEIQSCCGETTVILTNSTEQCSATYAPDSGYSNVLVTNSNKKDIPVSYKISSAKYPAFFPDQFDTEAISAGKTLTFPIDEIASELLVKGPEVASDKGIGVQCN